jgi:KDO2-lipid IV(A) lauroyltransferase
MSRRSRKIWRAIRDPIGAGAMRCSLALHGLPIPILRRMGAGAGSMLYALAGKERRVALDNLTRVYGDTLGPQEKKRLAREVFREFGRGALECMAYAYTTLEERKALVEVEGKPHLEAALQRGKGVIAVTAHFGNFMVLGPRLADEGYDVHLVVKAARDRHVEAIWQHLRQRMGIHSLYVRPTMVCTKQCLQALRHNGILILLVDQHYGKGGVRAEFLGHPCAVAPGAASLALATGASVLPMFMIREEISRQRLEIRPPIEPVIAPDKHSAIAATTQRVTDAIAEAVRRHPDHWSWMYRRWRL